jgi:hypothetical protein
MSSLEILSGDFETGVVRIRYSPAGRAYMRVTSRDGFVEDLFLEKDFTACFDSTEGRVGEKLRRWASENGIREVPDAARGERVMAVMLKDGRRIIGRTTPDVVAELKSAARDGSGPAAAPRAAAPMLSRAAGGFAGLVTRFFQPRD